MSTEMTDHYTHIAEKAARAAVEKLDKIYPRTSFVDEFVDEPRMTENEPSNLLN